jgi:hypothetical protein
MFRDNRAVFPFKLFPSGNPEKAMRVHRAAILLVLSVFSQQVFVHRNGSGLAG